MKNLGDGVYRTHVGLGAGEGVFEMILVYKEGTEEGEKAQVSSLIRKLVHRVVAEVERLRISQRLCKTITMKQT